MLESLTQRLSSVFAGLSGRGRLSEKDVDTALREIRLCLLEADVNLRVARDFVAGVRERAVGQEVIKSLSPAQQVVKIVRDELIELLGGETAELEFAEKPPTVIMLVGLQGAGKTTVAAKLARRLKQEKHRPLLAATDVHRPAAIEQLVTLGRQVDAPVFEIGDNKRPADIARAAVSRARNDDCDIVIVDTAGRQAIDQEMMDEAAAIRDAVRPQETLLVVDAMTGQDAVNTAREFDAQLGLSGGILTKLDGDARGGAVLSFRHVTGKPVKFVGVGETMEALEVFHPDRMVSRILGMGDVLSLIEQAESMISEEEALELERKLRRDEFDLADLLTQFQQMRRSGGIQQLLGMLPGMSAMGPVQVDERALARQEAIILSMTPYERHHPKSLTGSRKRRIARGSGTTPQEVNALLKQFRQIKRTMKQLGRMSDNQVASLFGLG